jgi:hypothetical protein
MPGDVHFFHQYQALFNHQDLFQHRDDQRFAFLARADRLVDHAVDRHALDRHVVAKEWLIDHLVALVNELVHADTPGLHPPALNSQHLLDDWYNIRLVGGMNVAALLL